VDDSEIGIHHPFVLSQQIPSIKLNHSFEFDAILVEYQAAGRSCPCLAK